MPIGGDVVRIDRVTQSRVEIGLHETFRTAIRETDSIAAIRIEIHAEGRVGVGYATATPAITGDTVERIESFLDDVVAPYLVGRDLVSSHPYVLGAQSNALFGIPHRDYEGWTLKCSSATAGVDLALHDLVFHSPPTSPSSFGSPGLILRTFRILHKRVWSLR